MGYSVGRDLRIWNDKTGEHICVGEDGDSLGLVDVRMITEKGVINTRITMERDQAILLAACLTEYCSNEQNFLNPT